MADPHAPGRSPTASRSSSPRCSSAASRTRASGSSPSPTSGSPATSSTPRSSTPSSADEDQRAETAAALESAKGKLRSEVGKQLGIRLDADAGVHRRRAARDRRAPRGPAARGPASATPRVAAAAAAPRYAGEADPYKKPRATTTTAATTTAADAGATAETPAPSPTPDGLLVVDKPAGLDQPRRRRPGPPAVRHPQGRPRRHARPDGDRRAGARRRPGHPAARPSSSAATRTYAATIRLGQSTLTDDAEGEVTASVRRPPA